jgi:hypothetical protein
MFNGIWLVANEALTYQGREIQAGEHFQCPRTRSGAFLVMGQARIAPPPQKVPETAEAPPLPRRRGRPRKIQTADIPAEESTESTETATPTRSYRRRDLEAEP